MVSDASSVEHTAQEPTEIHDPDLLARARALIDACASPAEMQQAVLDAVARNEAWRGRSCINLLAPEAPTSPTVRALLSSEVGTRAAEGHIGPVNRWFAGTRHIDEIEALCVELLKRAFARPLRGAPPGGEHARQPRRLHGAHGAGRRDHERDPAGGRPLVQPHRRPGRRAGVEDRRSPLRPGRARGRPRRLPPARPIGAAAPGDTGLLDDAVPLSRAGDARGGGRVGRADLLRRRPPAGPHRRWPVPGPPARGRGGADGLGRARRSRARRAASWCGTTPISRTPWRRRSSLCWRRPTR